MATPIAPTPTLTGKDAEKFLHDISNPQKVSKEKREKIFQDAAEIEKLLTFEFQFAMHTSDMRMVRLDQDYRFKPFDCGIHDLNEFLRYDSKDYLTKRLAVTYVLETSDEIVAYFSLANDKVSILDSNKSVWRRIKKLFPHRKHRNDYPAVKIGRFAVNVKYQNSFVGSQLMNFIKAMFLAKNRSGCAFITVDARLDAVPFYLKNDFKFLKSADPNIEKSTAQLYFDLNSL